jgi:transcriptional regulator with XRE-family HTH domain
VDYDATRRKLGGGIREWRKRRHLTQWELADAAELSPNIVGRVERGQGNPTLKVLWKIATQLKVNVAQLHLGPARE